MRKRLVFIIFLVLLPALAQTPKSTPALAEPAISPDAREIAFVSGGDIWTVPADGGEARLLVAHPANESRPLYSPDGRYLAFTSSRTGNGDVYVLTLATGDLKRLTWDDGSDRADSWSPDSRFVYFSSSAQDISGMNDIYRVSIDGGTPMPVTADRYLSEFFAAPSPDGKSIAFAARGVGAGQWWRHGHSHLDESEIWLLRTGAAPEYQRLTEGGARQLWPMWSGQTLYFVSDRSGQENIWSEAAGKAAQITNFTNGRVLWSSISADGRFIVFERDFRIWKLNLQMRQAAPVDIHLRGVAAGPAVEHRRVTDRIDDISLSPDGKKIVFAVRGDLFAASAKDGGDGVRITDTPSREWGAQWSPDSRTIVYLSDREGRDHIYQYDFQKQSETQLTRGVTDEQHPRFSPDGKWLSFQRGRRQLVVLDVARKTERVLAEGMLDRPPLGANRPFVWSPDSRWIAYMSAGARTFRNASVVRVDGGKTMTVSFVSNAFSNTLSWSPDGKFLLFDTGQRTEPGQVARVDLLPHTPKFREDQFRELFREERAPMVTPTPERQPATTPDIDDKTKPDAAKSDDAAKKDDAKPEAKKKVEPVEVVTDGIRQRLSLLRIGVDVDWQGITPDGKWLVIIASVAGQQNLYLYSLDELSREPAVVKQLTSTPGSKRAVQFTADSKEIYYLDDGKIFSTPIGEPRPKPLAVAAELDVDFQREKTEAFEQGWRLLRDNFFDEHMHGADWDAIHAQFTPYIAAARTPDEMRRLMSLMVGELNSSHSGVNAPPGETRPSTGRLGLRFEAHEYESSGRLRISEVIDLSPAAVAGIKVGEYLVAVDGVRLDAKSNLQEQLEYKIGRQVKLGIASFADALPRIVPVKPVNLSTEKALLYRQWVNRNREYVEKASKGRLGYVHMFDMSADALSQLTLDLDVENHEREGVVVDIRNNNGGFVNPYAIDVFARRGYMTMTMRGYPASPARNVLGQRALERPTVLLTNQHSLSDAEDFTEGYRTLQLGKVIGEPTAGWIIYTSNVGLVDGTILRIPFSRITDHEGKDMELHPRAVDIPVSRPVGESYTGKDSQLDRAISELLRDLDRKPAP
jgi:Tol biopolymer transport system component/C-terminal processing protease CtpA/Prc